MSIDFWMRLLGANLDKVMKQARKKPKQMHELVKVLQGEYDSEKSEQIIITSLENANINPLKEIDKIKRQKIDRQDYQVVKRAHQLRAELNNIIDDLRGHNNWNEIVLDLPKICFLDWKDIKELPLHSRNEIIEEGRKFNKENNSKLRQAIYVVEHSADEWFDSHQGEIKKGELATADQRISLHILFKKASEMGVGVEKHLIRYLDEKLMSETGKTLDNVLGYHKPSHKKIKKEKKR